jgi:IS element ISTsi1 orfA, putative resolvase
MKSITYLKKRFGIVPQTIRNYVKQGKLKAIKSANNRYYFEEAEINRFEREFILNNQNDQYDNSLLVKKANAVRANSAENWCFYLRSSEGNKVLLQNQETNLRNHYPEPKFVIKDSASGLNENRNGLRRMINKIKNGEITDVAVTQADRLSRFGNTYLIELFEAYNVKLHVLFDEKSLEKDTKHDLQQELMKDFMSLIASFSGRFYRLRSLENKVKLLDEVKNKIMNRDTTEEMKEQDGNNDE